MPRGLRNSSCRISPGVVGLRVISRCGLMKVTPLPMVVDHVDIFRAAARPPKDDPPLVVDPNTEEALQLPLEGLEPVRGWRSQVIDLLSVVQHVQLPGYDLGDTYPAGSSVGLPVEKEIGDLGSAEGP